MRNYLLYILLCSFAFTSCQSIGGDSESSKPEIEKKISKRDYSINESNSYSDLFLDSLDMEKFIAENQLSDSVIRRMRSFYNTRNFQFAWFSSDGLTEQALGFWNLHDYVTHHNNDSLLNDKDLRKKMESLVYQENLKVDKANKSTINTELKLTQHFIMYILNNYEKGYVKRKEMERFIPFKKQNILTLSDSLLNKKHNDDKYFEDVHVPYANLKKELGRYYDIAKKGGWPQITTSKKSFKKGDKDPVIINIKKHLSLTGDLPVADTTAIFNDTLELAVKNYQERFGFTPDGVIGAQVIKEMNVPVITRLEQIMMNLERMRWMPTHEATGRLILVNIPEFKLHVYEGKQKAFDMVVVVGKVGHNTMMFNGDLNQVVFSPYWNVPPSIVKSEILPAMASNPNYLASQNMEQTGTEGGVPVIRQKPGGKNALGKVKFLFPNSFNIYFHDTPSKSLFERDKRAFSHGCIRLQEPEKMANYLLKNNSDWDPQKINAAMNSGTEKYVKLKEDVPVVITYYTAWVDDNGKLNFREDIYKHDKKLIDKMFVRSI